MNLKKIFTADLFGTRPTAALCCPHCDTPLKFHPALTGETVLCPACKGPLLFATTTEHELALAALQEKKRRQQKTGPMLCYIAGAIALVPCWPIGLILIALGLLIGAVNKK
jgi:uncharacterized protein YbaR (Trm112 family)